MQSCQARSFNNATDEVLNCIHVEGEDELNVGWLSMMPLDAVPATRDGICFKRPEPYVAEYSV